MVECVKVGKLQARPIALSLVWLLSLILSLCIKGQSTEKTIDLLVKEGFENISWYENEKERVYVLENVAYRQNSVGAGKAVDIIQVNGMPESKPCRLVLLDNNVPQVSIYCNPVEVLDKKEKIDRSDWSISYDLGDSWRNAVRRKVYNSSLFKVDVVAYPELMLKNLIITQIYQVLFNIAPAVELSLWKGMKLTAQMVFPIYNDGYGDRAGKIHPGFITARQSVRLPFNLWAGLTIGCFNNERYGIDLDLKHVLKIDERFSFDARVGLTAANQWDGFKCTYGTNRRWIWSVGGNFYWPRYDVQLSLKGEQYLLGERGVRFDAIRHFRNASIGFYAMKAKGVRLNGGFRLQVLLPPYKYKRKGHIPRVLPSKNMGLAYNAGNERFYYKNYRSNPSDNIMQSNSFNPYYLKSEMLKY